MRNQHFVDLLTKLAMTVSYADIFILETWQDYMNPIYFKVDHVTSDDCCIFKSFLLKCWKGMIIKTDHVYVYSPALSPFSVIESAKEPTQQKTKQQL